jgi:hypothetical protein
MSTRCGSLVASGLSGDLSVQLLHHIMGLHFDRPEHPDRQLGPQHSSRSKPAWRVWHCWTFTGRAFGTWIHCALQCTPVHNLVSLAGPVNGVYGVPVMNALCPDTSCPWLASLMSKIAEGGYTEPVLVTFAQYWRDPLHYDAYLDSSLFLADINKERPVKNSTYKKNFITLNALVLVAAELEEIVVPPASEHFGFFAVGNDTQIVPMQETAQYQQDFFGLKTLDNWQGVFHVGAVRSCQHASREVQEAHLANHSEFYRWKSINCTDNFATLSEYRTSLSRNVDGASRREVNPAPAALLSGLCCYRHQRWTFFSLQQGP